MIHLVRDPRAILRSRRVGDWITAENLKSEAAEVCSAIETDLKLSDILPSDRWDGSFIKWSPYFFNIIIRYLRIKYEDFVQKPFESLNQLYNFAGLQIKANIYQTLWDKTHGNRQEILVGCSQTQAQLFLSHELVCSLYVVFNMYYVYFQFWFLRYCPWTKFWSKSLEVRLQFRGDQSHRGELSQPDFFTKLFNL